MAELPVDVPDQWGVWERIASSFDATRGRTWPHVEGFLTRLRPGSRLLDVMAGNGRHSASAQRLGLLPVALDWSRPLAAAAGARLVPAVAGDATALPFADGTFDAAVSVAGLHGLPKAADRAACLHEMHRVLRPGGRAQVTVWSRQAERFRADGPPGEPYDVLVPWRADGLDEARFYRLYTLDALVAESEAAGFVVESAAHLAVACQAGWDNEVVHLRR